MGLWVDFSQEWLDGKKLTEPGAASEQAGRVVKSPGLAQVMVTLSGKKVKFTRDVVDLGWSPIFFIPFPTFALIWDNLGMSLSGDAQLFYGPVG